MTVSEDGRTVTVGDRNFAIAGDTLVLWHKGAAGTFWGIKDALPLRTMVEDDVPSVKIGEEVPGLLVTSSSGGADIAALVCKVDRPLAVVTSGYRGRRDWSYLLVAPDGDGGIVSEAVSPKDYRARFAPVETL
jgi:hypothetical protein